MQVRQPLYVDWQLMSQTTMHGPLVLARLTRQAMPTAMSSCISTLWPHCLQAKAGQLTSSPTPVCLIPFPKNLTQNSTVRYRTVKVCDLNHGDTLQAVTVFNRLLRMPGVTGAT
jgi:hypothetical protein